MIRLSVTVKGIKKSDCMFLVTVQGLTGLKKTDGVNWETVKAIGFLYPNILDTLSNIFSGSSKRIKTSMLMHWQR